MKATRLAIPDVVLIEPKVFGDARGFFFESFNQKAFNEATGTNHQFVQDNHSRSSKGVLRGLHYQIQQPQGKLVRVVRGAVFDVAVDIRKSSPTFGQWVGEVLSADNHRQLWVPPGFAHGNYFNADSVIEYMCSGEYSPGCEAGVSPLAPDLDWSLCDPKLKSTFDDIAGATNLITEKDRDGFSLQGWLEDERSGNFVHGEL